MTLRFGAGLATLALWGLAVARSTASPRPAPLVTAEDGANIARELALEEPRLRRLSRRQFPYDTWSQDDAFHNREHAAVRAAGNNAGVDLGSILNALDVDTRQTPNSNRRTTAAPCKPRPFYD
jgi:hypothetical protein